MKTTDCKIFKQYLGKLLLPLLLPLNLLAQPGVEAPHPELKWYTIETEHFLVHFHEAAERSAKVTAKVAEEIFGPITSLYEFVPDGKVQFVIRDHDDFSNGAAFYYDNKITIWASSLDFELRGSHSWLRNVVTHEFTHMIQLQAGRKASRNLPAFYLQGIGYEKETRPEDLYGFPRSIVSYPVPLTVMPSWFAEGVAQYQIPGLGYDYWDSHRDMLLRTAVVEDKLLSFSEMSSFGKNSIGNERAYNQGYALSGYMAEKYGIQSLVDATKAMKSFFRFSFSSAIKKATGKSGNDVYRDWKAYLEEKYAVRTKAIRENLVAGDLFEDKGIGNFHPLWSADGSKIAFLASGGSDYLSRTALVEKNVKSGEIKLLEIGVQSAFDRSADGTFYVYAKRIDPNRHLSYYFDLYRYDAKTEKETRLTRDARAHSPAISPDGKTVAFVVNGDGTQNLATMNLDELKIHPLTTYKDGEQVFHPKWSPDGEKLLFSFTEKAGRQLKLLTVATGEIESIENDAKDSRDAIFSQDGASIIYSADRNGIFNIYQKHLKDGETVQLTNVIGGAFMPSISPSGELAFATFVAEGYKIAILRDPKPVQEQYTAYPEYTENVHLASNSNDIGRFNLKNIRAHEYNDTDLPDYTARPYRNTYGSLSFLPVIRRDYGTTKVGTYLASNDVLNGYNVFGGVLVNRDRDYDLFVLLEYLKLGPRLFVEGYNQVLHSSEGGDDFRYNLAQVNGGFETHLPYKPQHKLRAEFIYSRASAKVKTRVGNQPVSFGYTYYIGRTAQLRYDYDGVVSAIDVEANPRLGRRFTLQYSRDWNLFINGFEVNTNFGTLQEVYDHYYLHRIEADWREYFPLPFRHGLMFRLNGGYIDRPVNTFFAFLGGGLFGNRGYPYFAINGRRLLNSTIAYRLPLLWNMDLALGPIHFDKLFLGAFADFTNASNSDFEWDAFKKSAGLQVRLDTFSFYGFPTKFFFDAAYGFDEIATNGTVYGKEWRYYFGVTFGYLD